MAGRERNHRGVHLLSERRLERGAMTRLFAAITNQQGLFRQAAVVMGALKAAPAVGL